MALTVPDDLGFELSRLKANICVEVWLTVNYTGGNAVEYMFHNGQVPYGGLGAPTLVSLSDISREIDVWEGTGTVNTISVDVLSDSYSREMLVNQGTRGAYAVVKIGPDDGSSTRLNVFVGTVIEVIPRPGIINIKMKSAQRVLADLQVYAKKWGNQHPLEMITYLFSDAGLSTTFYNSSSFAYDSDLTRSHFVCGHETYLSAFDPCADLKKHKVDTLVMAIAPLLNGVLTTRESGKIEFIVFDTSASVDHVWGMDDIFDFQVKKLYDSIINEVTVEGSYSVETQAAEDARASIAQFGGEAQAAKVDLSSLNSTFSNAVFRIRDTASKTLFGTVFPAGLAKTAYTASARLGLTWIGGHAEAFSAMTAASPGVGDSFIVNDYLVHNMCGTRATFDSVTQTFSQSANALLSDSRLGYLLVDREIIKVDRCVIGNYFSWISYQYLNSSGTKILIPPISDSAPAAEKTEGWAAVVPNSASYRVLERGVSGGDAATTHDARSIVYDITMLMDAAQFRLSRAAYGCPEISFKTDLSKIDAQVGDIVTLVVPKELFCSYGNEGIGSTMKWQITGKKMILLDDKPHIDFTLTFAWEDSPPSPTYVSEITSANNNSLLGQASAGVVAQDTTLVHVASGFTLTTTATLKYSIGSGVLTNAVARFSFRNFTSEVLASKDTYVYANTFTKSISVRAVALGAAAPTYSASCFPLYKLVSDGTTITGSTTLYGTKALNGSKLVDLSVGETQIGALAVTEGKIAGLAVTEGKLGSLAVTEGKIAATAVTEGKLGALAVTAGKIASNAVTTAKVATDAITFSKLVRTSQYGGAINLNSDFSQW